MATTGTSPETSVQVKRTFAAPREKVFQAWIEPRLMSRWFLKPTAQHQPKMVHLDARPGGRYRFEVVSPETGKLHVLTGAFREIQPPERLVFTWRWENQPDFPETVVTVEFRQIGGSNFTEVILDHALLPEATRENHRKGWNGCFDALQTSLGPDFRMVLDFNASAEKLYDQVATQQGVRNWWTEVCEMDARVGGTASFRFPKADFYAVVRITGLEPHTLVEWECVDSKHPENSGYADLKDWIGTRIRFKIEAKDAGGSRLTFTHVGLAPLECAETCRSSWANYLNQSLRGYLERGAGEPYKA